MIIGYLDPQGLLCWVEGIRMLGLLHTSSRGGEQRPFGLSIFGLESIWEFPKIGDPNIVR